MINCKIQNYNYILKFYWLKIRTYEKWLVTKNNALVIKNIYVFLICVKHLIKTIGIINNINFSKTVMNIFMSSLSLSNLFALYVQRNAETLGRHGWNSLCIYIYVFNGSTSSNGDLISSSFRHETHSLLQVIKCFQHYWCFLFRWEYKFMFYKSCSWELGVNIM